MLDPATAEGHRQKMDGPEIGGRVRAIQEAKRPKLSQEALARQIGASRLTVSNIENGATEKPRYDTIASIASVLEVDVTCLINGDAPPTESTLDTSTADPEPLGLTEDMRWAALAAELDAKETEAFMGERRYSGPLYGRQALLARAMEFKGTPKVVDRAQAVEVELRPGTMMLDGGPKKR